MTIRYIALLAALALLSALPARADDLKPICPDRPGKITSACTVEAGHAQFELGFYDESFQRRSGVTTDMTSAGTPNAKYGMSENFDLEAGIAFNQELRLHDARGTQTISGIGDLVLHAKYNPGGDGLFSWVLDPYVKIPTAAAGLGNGKIEGGLVLPMAYDLGGGWSLAATPEADILHDAFGRGVHANLVNVVGLGRGFDGGLTLGAEAWTGQNFDPAGTVSQYSFDLSAALLAGNDTQLDCGVDFGLNRSTPDLEIYAGISRRF